MKKQVYLLAFAALSGSAMAQSSVTIFGIVDTALSRGEGSLSTRNRLVSSGNTTSRLGFRGVEDLGGGLSAGFWLEGSITSDTGEGGPSNTNNQTSGTTTAPAGTQGLTFGRRTTISLYHALGELRAGRDYSSQQMNFVSVDPFYNLGVGASQAAIGTIGGPTVVRVSNFVGYYLPVAKGGFYGSSQVYFGENLSSAGATANDGRGANARIGYRWGDLDGAIATSKTEFAKTATTGDIRSTNIGVSYKAGPVQLMSGYYVDKVEANSSLTGKGGIVGAIWTVGASEFKAALSNYKTDAGLRPESEKLALGYVYNLSKRTVVYTTFAHVKNSGGASTALGGSTTANNRGSSGVDFGIRTFF